MGPFMVTRCMSSTVSACLATPFKIKGINYSITSACSTSRPLHRQRRRADPVGQAGHRLRRRRRGARLDALLPLRRHGRDEHQVQRRARDRASRAFDADRDGFVIAGGGGMVVLEELEHARARGAKIYAEVTGYGATSDGHDMVAPSGVGGERAMRLALATLPAGAPRRLHQRPRHLDAGRRRQRGRGGPPRLRRGQDAADQLDQVDDRPQPGRHRRAGGDLLPADAARRLHRPLDQRRDARPRASAPARSPPRGSTTPASTR